MSCITTKYSLSANCRREVSLADALKKPIVPLLLERISWPPEGPMALVFTQLLYINFTKPDVDVQNHWTCPEFDELLGKLGNHVHITSLQITKQKSESKMVIDKSRFEEIPDDEEAPVEKKKSPEIQSKTINQQDVTSASAVTNNDQNSAAPKVHTQPGPSNESARSTKTPRGKPSDQIKQKKSKTCAIL